MKVFHFARGIKNLFSGQKIRRQLLTVYILAGFLPILILGMYLVLNTRALVINQHYSQAIADNLRVRSIILDITTSLENISDDLFSDTALHDILREQYPSNGESYAACRTYTKMNYYTNNYTEISDLTLYVNNRTICDYGNFKTAPDEVRDTEWYQRAQKSVGNYLWMTIGTKDMGGTPVSKLALIRKIPIFNSGGEYAILVISINNNYLKTRVNNGTLKTELSATNGPIFYSNIPGNNGSMPGMDIDTTQLYFKFSGITQYNGQEDLVQVSTVVPVESTDSLYIITIDDKALPAANKLLFNCILIVIVNLLAAFIMVGVFSKTFSARIITLRQQMHKVSQGDYNIIEDFKGNDELVELFADLKTMIESIKKMDAEIFNERVTHQELINHQQEMQFMMLTSQINPHFLYNTLETIRMKAYKAGNREVSNAIKLLGKSMRHVLEANGKPGSLDSELEYIRIYLEIQKMRFLDRFDYDITVSEEVNTHQYMIVPLLLQPIVENSIVHGLENKESGGFIQISVFVENERLIISVSDNGEGMTKEVLDSLRERVYSGMREGTGRGIGLLNIYQRITLYYGRAYGIDIRSEQGLGTQVLIYLPISHEGKEEGTGKG